MRSIERRFLDLQQERPFHSSLLNLGAAVKGQNFSEGMVRRWFNKLVEKDDYEGSNKREVIAHLTGLSNSTEESRKTTLNALLRREKVCN